MSAVNDGGPAFPEVNNIGDRAPYLIIRGGMTLRDWFAGQALAGLMANPAYAENTTNEGFSKGAYDMADAMLATRNNQNK